MCSFGLISLISVEDDEWGENELLQAPKYLFTAIVTRDYIPENNSTLTLIMDDLVYVFKTQVTGKPGNISIIFFSKLLLLKIN